MSLQTTTYQCKTLEILHYPGINAPQLLEGVVDDSTLEGWFCKVTEGTRPQKHLKLITATQVPSTIDAGTQVERKAIGGLRILCVPPLYVIDHYLVFAAQNSDAQR